MTNESVNVLKLEITIFFFCIFEPFYGTNKRTNLLIITFDLMEFSNKYVTKND